MTAVETGLDPVHAAELSASEINDPVSAARGYRTLYGSEGDRALLKELRIPRWAWRDESAFPGLLIPMYRVTGEVVAHQFKPAVPQQVGPEGKAQKYASPTGTPNHIDVPLTAGPDVQGGAVPLWITEGVKKADCLASRDRAVVAITGVWNWRNKMGTLGDWEDIPISGRPVVVCFDSDAREKRPVLLAMKRFGAWLESKGASEVRYLIVPGEVDGTPVKGVDDFFHAGGSMEGLAEASVRELSVEGAKDAAFSDASLAVQLCDEHLDGTYRWASGLGWMRWDGKVWKTATEATITETVRRWVLESFSAVMAQQRSDPNRDFKSQMDGWRSVLGVGRIGGLVRLSKGILECGASDFDADPDLLNCPNGVADLRSGSLLPADPDLLMTKITGVDYVRGAVHPDWDKALEAVPEDVREWYRLRIGQAITGHMTPDDLAVICQGGGSNGKTTVADAMASAVGSYHMVVSDRAMLGRASDNHPTEMMDFLGARYAVLEETPEAKQLDVVRLKKLTGTPEIEARRIRQDPVTFTATHSLFVNTNYKPVVSETDHGTWRRLALVRFPYTYRRNAAECRGAGDRVGDAALRQRVKTGPQAQEAVLAWMVAGAMRWYALDRIMPEPPDRVAADTLAWREESDPILGFLNDMVHFDPAAHVMSSELFTAFGGWMKERNNKEWSSKTFTARFGGHDACSQRGVDHKLIRHRDGLSRLNGARDHAASYRAWTGLRFRGADEEVFGAEADQEQDRAEAMIASDLGRNGCNTSGNDAHEKSCNLVIDFGVTPVTRSCSQDPSDQGNNPGTVPSGEAANATAFLLSGLGGEPEPVTDCDDFDWVTPET